LDGRRGKVIATLEIQSKVERFRGKRAEKQLVETRMNVGANNPTLEMVEQIKKRVAL